MPVVFVTARPLRWMDELWPMVGGHASPSSRTARSSSTWRRGRCVSCAASGARRAGARGGDLQRCPGATIAIETLSGIRVDPSYDDALHPVPPGSPVGPVAELWTDPAAKVLVRHPDMDPVRFREAVVEAVGALAVPTWTLDGLMEISAPGVTKGSALVELAAELGWTPPT